MDGKSKSELRVGASSNERPWVDRVGGSLGVALDNGRLLVVSELLLHFWRVRKERLSCFTEPDVFAIFEKWGAHLEQKPGGNTLSRADAMQFCTLLVLSCRMSSSKAVSGRDSAWSAGDERASRLSCASGASSSFGVGPGHNPAAHNPVLVALRLSIRSQEGARWHTRDRRRAERLRHVAEMLETIACGLIDGALLAEEQSKEKKGYNPWRTGKANVEPAAARRLWVEGSVGFSATRGLVRFSSVPTVYAHLQRLFFPRDRTPHFRPLHALELLLGNVAVVPLLPFLPRHLEHTLEQRWRAGKLANRASGRFHLLWLIPSVKMSLWLLSSCGLTALLSLSGLTDTFRWTDAAMLCFAAAIAEAELSELYIEGARAYFRELFNILDVLLLLLLLSIQVTHVIAIRDDRPSLQHDVSSPLQALAILGSWLRLLQVLHVAPNLGGITTIHHPIHLRSTSSSPKKLLHPPSLSYHLLYNGYHYAAAGALRLPQLGPAAADDDVDARGPGLLPADDRLLPHLLLVRLRRAPLPRDRRLR